MNCNSPHQSLGTLGQSDPAGRNGSKPEKILNQGIQRLGGDLEQILKAWIQPSQPQKTYRLSSPSPTALGLVLPDDVIQAHVHLQSTFKKIKLDMNF